MPNVHKAIASSLTIFALLAASPAWAGWTLVQAKSLVDLGGLKVTALSDWNQDKGHLGPQTVAWTHDSMELNSLQFFVGVPAGGTLYKDRDKKRNPLPNFNPDGLIVDQVEFFERTFRAQNQVSNFTILEIKPSVMAGTNGIQARYEYSLPNDDLVRQGVVRIVVVGRRLYGINFQAPKLHFFANGLPEVDAIMDSALIG